MLNFTTIQSSLIFLLCFYNYVQSFYHVQFSGAGMAAGQPDYSKEWSEYLKNMAAPVGGASAAQITPASLQQATQPQAPGLLHEILLIRNL